MTYLFLIVKDGRWIATSRDGKLMTTDEPRIGSPLVVVDPLLTVPTEDLMYNAPRFPGEE